MNPRACHELEKPLVPTSDPKHVLVVGGGPAGLAAATTVRAHCLRWSAHWRRQLAQRGHTVTLVEASSQLGGQFNMAKVVPGKADFQYTIDYYKRQLEVCARARRAP